MAEARAAYLSLGANLGNREETLRAAVRRIADSAGITLRAVSSLYETEPWGKTEQPLFLNIALSLQMGMTPEALLARAQKIETALGRVRHERWGARTIDIDLLHVEGIERNTPSLALPHPYMTERAFVLVPLAEIAPKLVVRGRTVETWKQATGGEGVHLIAGPEWADVDGGTRF